MSQAEALKTERTELLLSSFHKFMQKELGKARATSIDGPLLDYLVEELHELIYVENVFDGICPDALVEIIGLYFPSIMAIPQPKVSNWMQKLKRQIWRFNQQKCQVVQQDKKHIPDEKPLLEFMGCPAKEQDSLKSTESKKKGVKSKSRSGDGGPSNKIAKKGQNSQSVLSPTSELLLPALTYRPRPVPESIISTRPKLYAHVPETPQQSGFKNGGNIGEEHPAGQPQKPQKPPKSRRAVGQPQGVRKRRYPVETERDNFPRLPAWLDDIEYEMPPSEELARADARFKSGIWGQYEEDIRIYEEHIQLANQFCNSATRTN